MINDDNVMVGYIQQDPDKAIKNLKDVLMAYKYHQQPNITKYWQSQKNRVGDMLERMDQLIPSKQAPSYDTYVSMNLKSEWNIWIEGRVTFARQKAVQYMQNWIKNLKDGYIPSDRSKLDSDVLKRIEKIEKLDAAITKVIGTAWNL